MRTESAVKIPTVEIEMSLDNLEDFITFGFVQVECPACQMPHNIEIDFEGRFECEDCGFIYNVEPFV